MTNSYLAHAKNVHLHAEAFYYAPSFFTVKAEEKFYQLNTVPIEKAKTKYSKTMILGSIKN